MGKIILFHDKTECCGCEACVNICPQKAIHMEEDEYGFRYPSIDESLCVGCGLCQRVCGYKQVEESNVPISTYVACTLNTDIMKSASGGVFASLAKSIIEMGGIVYGVSMENINGELIPMHIGIEAELDLIKLQGSKYVQSVMGDTYNQVKKQLMRGRKVLFSGTPCQVAGLKAYVGDISKDNLLLVDIICHGVPSVSFYQGYIKELEGKLKGKVTDFKFRDKTSGWGLVGKVSYLNKKNEAKSKLIYARESSYYQLFLKGDVYRENCYSCKYASGNRQGDITLGDYWGIEHEHPEYLVANGGDFDEAQGISCMLINTSKGKAYLEQVSEGLRTGISSFEKAARKNGQLCHPTETSDRRQMILDMYVKGGYREVDTWFKRKNLAKIPFVFVLDRIPVSVKKKIRRILNR